MATSNNKFLVKNGLAVGGSTGPVDVIDADGNWIGATGSLSGATGPAGADGASGISGASGYVGSDGATGPQGATGPVGASGATGIQGASGSTGLQGASGATGLQGASGATGFQGASGSTGLDGASGATGHTGATGIQGASGPKADSAWVIVTGATSFEVSTKYLVDTTGGAFTVTLPASPNNGDTIIIADGGDFNLYNLTIDPNGNTIAGISANTDIITTGIMINLIYYGTWLRYDIISPIDFIAPNVIDLNSGTGALDLNG